MCSCGKSKSGGVQKWKVTYADGSSKTFSSETDARIEASSNSGARVARV